MQVTTIDRDKKISAEKNGDGQKKGGVSTKFGYSIYFRFCFIAI